MKFLPQLLVALLALPAVTTAADWTAESAAAEMSTLLASKTKTRDELVERQNAITAWMKRVETEKLDLGRHAYLLAVAKYLGRDFPAATKLLTEYFSKHREIPEAAHARDVGRALMSATNNALRAKDVASAEVLAGAAARYFPDALTVYRVVATQLLRDRSEPAIAFLNRILHAALGDERLGDREKQDLLARLYANEALAGAAGAKTADGRNVAKRAAVPSRKFVPFSDVDMDGKKVTVADYRGKVLLVDFWATWCGPCIREMPNVVKAFQEYHDQGFEVIGVSLDGPGSDARIRKVAKQLGMSWPQIYDGKGWRSRIATMNSIRSIPATFLLDRQGNVRYTNLRGRALAARVAELAKEPASGAK